jgi:hypothetical protein
LDNVAENTTLVGNPLTLIDVLLNSRWRVTDEPAVVIVPVMGGGFGAPAGSYCTGIENVFPSLVPEPNTAQEFPGISMELAGTPVGKKIGSQVSAGRLNVIDDEDARRSPEKLPALSTGALVDSRAWPPFTVYVPEMGFGVQPRRLFGFGTWTTMVI